MWDILTSFAWFLLGPWTIPSILLTVGFYILYTRFDPIFNRNSQPQNTSHYHLPIDSKPSKAVGDEEMLYFYASATELGRFVREKRISSTKLVQKFIDRLINVNTSINAAVNYRFSQAIDEALICDDVIMQLTTIYQDLQLETVGTLSNLDLSSYSIEDYPFLTSLVRNNNHIQLNSNEETLYQFLTRYLPPFFGIPCTTKECFALKGMPHTSGLVSRRHQLADYTAPVVLNMQFSGLVIIATSNTSELCMWMESANCVYGQTRNPYHLRRTPGGSSGGEGALLGSLATPISLGSDVGGSIRMPAFFNGIYGHKPTSSYVSCLGQVPSSRGGIPDFFCQAGPMARYPADLWPMLQVMLQTHSNGNGDIMGDSVLGLKNEIGVFGEKRKIQLLQRPLALKVDVESLRNEYSTTAEGKTIVDHTSKHFHNPHGISGKYQPMPLQDHGLSVLKATRIDVKVKNIDSDDGEIICQENHGNLENIEQNKVKLLPNLVENVQFTPYPHQNSKYYEFNALKQHTQESFPILTSSHPDQIYYSPDKPQNQSLPRIHTLNPTQIDYKQVVVYSLRSFGSAAPVVSSIDTTLLLKQRDAAQFYANMGCTVYEIDVDQLVQYYKDAEKKKLEMLFASPTSTPDIANVKALECTVDNDGEAIFTGVYQLQQNPNFFIPIENVATLTKNENKPKLGAKMIDPFSIPQVEFFREFVNAFEYWSAGMTLTFSAFRELLLQDCTVEAMRAIRDGADNKNKPISTQTHKNGQNDQNDQNDVKTKPSVIKTQDSAHDPTTDYTSYETLSKYTTLSPDAIDNLNPFQHIIYLFLSLVAAIFHTIRSIFIKIALPLEGIPHFGEVEGAVEIRRQNQFRSYLQNVRKNNQSDKVDQVEVTTPSISDIYPPMPLSAVQTPSMSLIKRIFFEIRVASYIIYHLLLSLFSTPLVPTGARCLAETQNMDCWYDIRPIPPHFDNKGKSGGNNCQDGHRQDENGEKSTPKNESSSLIMTDRILTALPSLEKLKSQQIYQQYLLNKSKYPYCNCTHVLQSNKQVVISLSKSHNQITIKNIISSFLPQTPYTFPALLLGLIDRVGDLTPTMTLNSYQKCLKFSQKLNSLLQPTPTQPFGGVLLAPPHPRVAPGHGSPTTRPFDFVYTGIFNATLSPVTSVPLGLERNLPTGIQIVAARHCDVTGIAMALLLHEQFGGWQPMKRLHSKYYLNKQ